MCDNRTISKSTFGQDAHIHQGDAIVYFEGSVSVTNNYGMSSPETTSTNRRDGEDGILRRLYTTPYEDRKNRNPSRVPGTCNWFTSHELFQDWQESKSSRLLWVSADPGGGKSVLVKYLVDSVLQTTESRTVCYFFFKDDFSDQRNIVSALCCILRQLFIQKPLLFGDNVLRQFVTGGETFFNSFAELWKTLIQISKAQSAGEIICIFDAIDECEDQGRSQLAQELCKLYDAANDFHLKFLLTSRPYGKIHRGFRPLEVPGLPVIHLSGEQEDEVRKISQEIDVFIRFKVQEMGKRRKLLEEEQNLLLQELMKIPHRTYLWVYLTLDLIEGDIIVDQTIFNAASCIPETVDEAYERILSKSCDFEQAKKILHIVSAAARPLTLKEMNLALALQKCHQSNNNIKLKPEERFHQELRDICGLFITIFDSKIYLLHQTAKEFLISHSPDPLTDICEDFIWKHSLNVLESHNILSDICIWYLCNLQFDINRYDGAKALCLRAEDMIFLDYSAKYWAIHFRELHMKLQKDKTELILKICDVESEHCQMWLETYWTSTNTEYPQGFTSLMITAYFGLQTAVQYFLNDKVDINSQDYTYQRSALSWAARNGFDTIVKLLIWDTSFRQWPISFLWRKRVKIDQVDIYGRTPLSYAVWNGSTAIVELLINAGALVHLMDELGGTPISYAYFGKNERIIHILLRKKDQLAMKNDIHNLLFSAAVKGHEEVVELLLKTSRVSPNARNMRNETPLLCAAKGDHEAAIKVLLERGADPNHRDNFNQTPLLYAAEKGNVAIVNALLGKGADLNYKKDGDKTLLLCDIKGERQNYQMDVGGTPLLCAIKGGHEQIVRILLEKGADPNSRNIVGQTPLLDAAARGSVAIVKALLDKGADLNYKIGTSGTPLSHAIRRGHAEIVKILLEGGANLDRMSLFIAAKHGQEVVVKALLERGVDPNRQDCFNRSSLSYAAQKGYTAVVKILLEGGASPTHHDRFDRSSLSYAAGKGHTEVVKILLDAGADSRPQFHIQRKKP
ncbi:hypothetical protein TGAM01_v201214 [Trichoderma gamsii]|uniref:Uncharacterized protein n=1 Tax=Trichoderma gamsii TaxID=398673 RepID=A0A2P5A002_9HYPO|nr:hypothetical protein TGAM01_v201214 [Trichoderma gamsii]PON29848.1 hypothetical protein TGAM01_v201214 [Trichoderma gamsii]